jgi:ubiquitin carboxyl-terminal hydrolase 34
MEEGKEHYGPASKDYFWLLCHLLDSLSEDFVKGTRSGLSNSDCLIKQIFIESLNGGCVIELEGLAVSVSEAIAKRDYLEGRLLEDEGLVGLLNLACNIIKHDPPFKTSAQGQTFLQQVFDFLFSLPDPSKRYLPKCKSILARNAAYDLLVEMCRRAPKNYAIVHTKLLEQHQPSKTSD